MSGTDRGRTAVTVRIAGEEHTIRANVEPEYTRRCAQLVDERIREIRSRSGLLETHKAAILAALSITDELFRARDELEAAGKSVAEQASRLTAQIEEHMRSHSSKG
jgi:cell division protein ZapA